MADGAYRSRYVEAHTRQVLAKQMREFRGEMSQAEFREKIGKSQTVVSRLENPNYHGWTTATLFEVAGKLDVAVLIRFVDFPTFLKYTDDMSEAALHPAPYSTKAIDSLVADETGPDQPSAALSAFSRMSRGQPPAAAAESKSVPSGAEGSIALDLREAQG
jgi:hypothetical protein